MEIYGLQRIERFVASNKGRGLEGAFEGWRIRTWFARWGSFADVRATFRHVDKFRRCYIFDIGGNKARLIVNIDFEKELVDIRRVLTHGEYDRELWKECCL